MTRKNSDLHEPTRLTALVSELHSKIGDDAETFWLAAPVLERFIRDGGLRGILEEAIDALATRPTTFYKDAVHRIWGLHADRRIALRLVIADTAINPKTLIHGSASHQLIFPVARTLIVHRFRHLREHDPSVFDRSLKLEAQPVQVLEPGQHLQARAFSDVLEIIAETDEDHPVMYLHALSHSLSDVRWAYHRDTLTPAEIASADLRINHLQTGMGVLLALGHPDPVPAFTRIFEEHPNHQVRWQALRAVMEVDEQKGGELLERATRDPHQHVRAAAERALARK